MKQLTTSSLITLLLLLGVFQAEAKSLGIDKLSQETHFHGIAFDPENDRQLYLATHHGFYVIGLDGQARQVSKQTHDFMGFTLGPGDKTPFFASGHPKRGGNLGILVSSDGGQTWTQQSAGAGGPVDFHQLTLSLANLDVLYGAYRGQLQVSRDAGASWEVQGPSLEGLIDLSGSALDAERLYAATRSGMGMSSDGGKTWSLIHPERRPVSSVVSTPQGDLYAFMIGVGLLQTSEDALEWQVVDSGWGEDYLMHLAVDGQDRSRLVGIDRQNRVLVSSNGGRDWSPL